MTLGIIGTGTMAAAIVSGLHASGQPPARILLSPRNAATGSRLAARFSAVAVAPSNQQVLDQSDTVLLAVRPQIAGDVLSELRFRADHHVISIIAALGIGPLELLIAPARRIVRAVPLPSAARGQSPTALYPPDPDALKMFSLLGPAFPVDTEEQFNAICTATAAVASYFGFLDGVSSWLQQHGVPAATARDYLARMFPSLPEEAAEAPTLDFRQMASRHATRGGLNEQLLRHLEAHHVFETLSNGLDEVMRRVTSSPSGPIPSGERE